MMMSAGDGGDSGWNLDNAELWTEVWVSGLDWTWLSC